MEPGASPPADVYPILKLIPQRLAPWKQRAIDAGKTMDASWAEARRRVEARRATGVRRDCIIDQILDEYEVKGFKFSQHSFNNLMGELVEGAADTTASQICTLIMAFALNPHIQSKARAELDKVCGPQKPPKFENFKDLPYINAIVKEGMRWRPT